MVASVPRKIDPTPQTTAKKQFNVRLPPDLRKKLDAWRVELNQGRRLELTQSDMVRGILDWACEQRPDWEKR